MLDVVKLSNVLLIKYDLNTNITVKRIDPNLHIPNPNLIKIVKPHTLESFWCKLLLDLYLNN